MPENRADLIRRIEEKVKCMRIHAIEMSVRAGNEGAHIGPGFSIMEIVGVLYFGIMRIDPKNPSWPERDRFILSKGHGVLGYYPALFEKGYFSLDVLHSFEQAESSLAGHPCMKVALGIDCSTGSLGHGLSVGVGMAMAARMDKKGYCVYVLIGDGEQNEGMVWEAAMTASHYGLSNLVAIIDKNKMQFDGLTRDVLNMDPLDEKWKSFGWNVREANGHRVDELLEALDLGKRPQNGPYVVIANTVKGKGVSFFENNNAWHHARLTEEDAKRALDQIESA